MSHGLNLPKKVGKILTEKAGKTIAKCMVIKVMDYGNMFCGPHTGSSVFLIVMLACKC